jgi:acyl-CoA thioesterase FadM
LEYHAPALYDELLQVGLRLESIGNSSLRYGVISVSVLIVAV